MKMVFPGDDIRYVLNGEPERCIECAEMLIFRHYPRRDGLTTIQIYCPHYGSEPNKPHESYRWISS